MFGFSSRRSKMNRFFGKAKPKAPPPSLTDCIGTVGAWPGVTRLKASDDPAHRGSCSPTRVAVPFHPTFVLISRVVLNATNPAPPNLSQPRPARPARPRLLALLYPYAFIPTLATQTPLSSSSLWDARTLRFIPQP